MVVFFDIDGTVVDNATQIIPQSAMDAIRALGENGHTAVVNTGRPYSHIDPRVRQIPFRGWICGCGMDIRLDGKQLYYTHPDQGTCDFAIRAAREYGMEPLFEADDGSIQFFDPETRNPHAARERDLMRKKGFAVNAIADHPNFMKHVTWDNPNCRRDAYIEAVRPRFNLIFRENNMIEHLPVGCSKAMGMQKLLSHMGVSREETLAIGDSTNDIPMFSVAKHTVCMGGGMQELQREAEYITAPVMDNGIQKALKHYGLI